MIHASAIVDADSSIAPDVKIGPEGLGHFLFEKGTQTFSGYPTHQFAEEIPVGQGVVADRCSRLIAPNTGTLTRPVRTG